MSKSSARRAPDMDEESSSGSCDAIMIVKKLVDRLVDCCIGWKWTSILIAMLPSIYVSCVLMWINTPTGLPTTLALGLGTSDYNDPVVKSMLDMYQFPATQYVGCLAGFTILFGLMACPAIWFNWPGILMITTWSVDVVGHFFLVFFILVLLSSQTAFKTNNTWEYKTFMNIFVGTLLPACLAWSFTGTAMARRRVKQSGEDGEQLA